MWKPTLPCGSWFSVWNGLEELREQIGTKKILFSVFYLHNLGDKGIVMIVVMIVG